MAKYKAKMYADALVGVLLDKKSDDKKITANFLNLLEKNQDMKKASQILSLAQRLLLKRTGNKKVILETARKVDARDIAKSLVNKGDIVEEKINPALVAGMKIILNDDWQIDLSLQRKLEELFL